MCCLLFLPTVWKFQKYSVIQIFREIKVGISSTVSKYGILTHLESLNYAFYKIWHFLNAEIYQIDKFGAPKMAKTPLFQLLNSPKLISRNI